jgi:hypothetical protein
MQTSREFSTTGDFVKGIVVKQEGLSDHRARVEEGSFRPAKLNWVPALITEPELEDLRRTPEKIAATPRCPRKVHTKQFK